MTPTPQGNITSTQTWSLEQEQVEEVVQEVVPVEEAEEE